MKTRRTVIFSMLVFVLGMSLLMLGSPKDANAGTLSQTEWEDIAGYIDGYIQSQYVSTDDGERGFIQTPQEYKDTVDNDGGLPGDGIVCGVGDDIKNRPVLVDNLMAQTTLIPGTSIRNKWKDAVDGVGGLTPTNLSALRDRVIAHREAGFSTDIAVY